MLLWCEQTDDYTMDNLYIFNFSSTRMFLTIYALNCPAKYEWLHGFRSICLHWIDTGSLKLCLMEDMALYGHLTRCAKLRVVHAPGMPGTFPLHSGLAIPTCIKATCRDACRDGLLVVSFEVGDLENVSGILGACATRNSAYLVRGP